MATTAKSSNDRKARNVAEPRSPSPALSVPSTRPLPGASVHKAAKALKHFSLSRFSKDAHPHNYVPASKTRDASTVQSVQRKMLARQVAALPAASAANSGMTIALPAGTIKEVLPSFKGGTVDLAELLGLVRQRMQGREFYAVGNPTLTRLTRQSELQSQVNEIIATIKRGVPK